jgi:hypothetical protein
MSIAAGGWPVGAEIERAKEIIEDARRGSRVRSSLPRCQWRRLPLASAP